MIATHHVAKNNTPIHNILSIAPQLSISQKALGTFPKDYNVMTKHARDKLLHLLVFHANVNEMHGSRSNISIKKSRQATLR
jgi:hypothetical protein